MHDDRLGYLSKSYFSQLETINNALFTVREIDVLACVLHMRGNIKIAAILNISPRTVETHILNIKRKIERSAREAIIDFVERSGKLTIIRRHYQALLIKAEFNKKLKLTSIAARNKTPVCHFCIPNKEIEISLLAEEIKTYFKFLGIKTIIYKKAEEMLFQHKNEDHFIYVVNNQESICFKYVEQANKSPPHYTFLVFNNIKEPIIKELIASDCVINFDKDTNYYLTVFNLLQRLFPTINFNNIIFEFKTYYQAVTDPIPQHAFIYESNSIHENKVGIHKKLKNLVTLKIIFISLTAAGLAIYLLLILKATPDMLKINKELAKFTESFASSVTMNNKVELYYKFEKEAEKIMKYFDDKEVQVYFYNAKPSELMSYLYSMHVISTHYTYDKHDGVKARELLLNAKNLAEEYIQKKSNVLIDFKGLSKEEIYAELSRIEDLPEIYTKIIYSLGRTYLYQGNFNEALTYFELSKSLGYTLELFEGPLSARAELEVKNRQIEIEMKTGNSITLKQKIEDLIYIIEALRSDGKEYKVDYSPNGQFKITIPNKDIYNVVCCGEEIVKHYLKLIVITKDRGQKNTYAKKILIQFVGSKLLPGLLSQSKEIAKKKAINIYNTLGYVLLKLYDENINFRQFKGNITKELDLHPGDDLEIIQQIFNLSKLKSRSNDFTKADAYDGLLKVQERRLNQKNTMTTQVLETEIHALRNKRDSINKELNRTPYYDLYFSK